jgi:uncharacterized zinc-type alcohol dehydrogenase-like protein
MALINAWAAQTAGAKFEPFQYEPAPLGPEEVDIQVEHCGICHSDLSMLNNDWGITSYPFVPGHEAIGRVVALGDIAKTKGLKIGQRVGVGWSNSACLHCDNCLRGEYAMCTNAGKATIGFGQYLFLKVLMQQLPVHYSVVALLYLHRCSMVIYYPRIK